MFRRHPLLITGGLLVVACLIATAVLLATFDLNRYRGMLENRLSSALNQPVGIGSARLSWHNGPVFDFTDLRIAGAPPDRSQAEIAHLLLQPRLLPLLHGQLVFTAMTLERPRYRLQRLPVSRTDPDGKAPSGLLSVLLQTIQVHRLTIIDGTLTLEDKDSSDRQRQWDITGLNIRVRNLFTGRPARITLKAMVPHPDRPATVELTGRVTLPDTLRLWRQARGNVQVKLLNGTAEMLQDLLPPFTDGPALSGRARMLLSASGSPASGVRFEGQLHGEGLALAWPAHNDRPVAITQANIRGTWASGNALHSLSKLRLRLNDLELTGHLSLQSGRDEPWLEGTLTSAPLAIPDMLRLLPDRTSLPGLGLLKRHLKSGRLTIDHLRFAGPLSRFSLAGDRFPWPETQLTLRDVTMAQPRFAPIRAGTFTLTLRNDRLNIRNGSALFLDAPVQFSGTVEELSSDHPRITLGAGWVAPTGQLCRILTRPAGMPSLVNGPMPVTLSLSGSATRLQGRLKANLDACAIEINQAFHKPAGVPGEIRLNAELREQRLTLTEGHVQLAPFSMHLAGQALLAEDGPLELRADLSEVDLAQAVQRIPLLACCEPRGLVGARLRLAGTLQQPGPLRGSIHLNGIGLRIPEIQSDLHDIRGTLTFAGRGAHFSDLHAVLGQSPLTLAGELPDITDPVFTLKIAAPSIQARELIFPSRAAVLPRLVGTLVFSDQLIRYQDLSFDLNDSTGFRLEGTTRISPPYTTELTVHAGQADIDDVLELWDDDELAAANADTPDEESVSLSIHATVDRGVYGRLRFNDAEGLLTYNEPILAIDPLHFAAGPGRCEAKILIDESGEGPSQVTFSGQFQNFDAESLYSDLLQRQGLVKGALNGHIELAGPADENFLAGAGGRMQLRITDGVLHKFSFLAKVFSLLNLSRIFTFHLPDMSREGMPFNDLRGTFDLDEGQLTTEDLAITSHAMNLSLVGRIDLLREQLDLVLGVKPFGTVDKIISKIPLAGWLLTGEEKALITAHFRIRGDSDDPEVKAIPISSVSGKVLGIFQRVLGLPGKVVEDVEKLFEKESEKEAGKDSGQETGQQTTEETPAS
jgi:hypothetical protein